MGQHPISALPVCNSDSDLDTGLLSARSNVRKPTTVKMPNESSILMAWHLVQISMDAVSSNMLTWIPSHNKTPRICKPLHPGRGLAARACKLGGCAVACCTTEARAMSVPQCTVISRLSNFTLSSRINGNARYGRRNTQQKCMGFRRSSVMAGSSEGLRACLLQASRRSPVPRIPLEVTADMFDNLNSGLEKAWDKLKGAKRLTKENMRAPLKDIRQALLQADVSLPVVRRFVKNVEEKAVGVNVRIPYNEKTRANGYTFTGDCDSSVLF